MSIKRPSRPTTPLRRVDRGSLSASHSAETLGRLPLAALDGAFAEMADSFADFQANMQQLVELGQGISHFNESFASFLYGMNVNAFCVDFPEAPIEESFKRHGKIKQQALQSTSWMQASPVVLQPESKVVDDTFLTTDDSFVEHPAPPKPDTAGRGASTRGRGTRGRGRGVGRGVVRKG